ncbi:MAG: twin-arginine translocation signal domain-containing protein [Planctomycetia bacterium]|nr:twin-arginine translocation signal domain-containing protein [Planctomycetia bacterium]
MHPSRRDFLEHALAATGVALAGLPTPPAAAAESQPPAASTAAGKVRMAVIGVNGQGSLHVAELKKVADVDLVAICDCDPGAYVRLCEQQFKGKLRPPEYVQDVRRLLDRRDIDAVTIATPNHWHALMAVWAMQSGKDVYVEKPCSHNVEEGRVIVQWARKLGRMCQMGVQSRSMSGMRETIEFINSGKIGDVKAARAICYRQRDSIGHVETPAPIPPGLDFDLWAGPVPAEVPKRKRLHYDWHWTHRTGNGDLGNQNPHELDKARWGLGKQELPRRVVSLGGRLGYVDNGDVANCQVTIFQWDDALLISDVRGLPIRTPVTFGLKGPKPFTGACNVWYGTEGFAVGPNYTSGAAFSYDGAPLGAWSGGAYRDHFANFVAAVKSRNHADLHLDIEDGHLSSALAHLGNVSWALGENVRPGTRPTLAADDPHVAATWESFESYLADHAIDYDATKLALGRELTIDPRTERSADAEANRLFGREYRRGFELPRA